MRRNSAVMLKDWRERAAKRVAGLQSHIARLRLSISAYSAKIMERLKSLLPHSIRRSLVGKLLALLMAGTILIYVIAVSGLWWVATYIIEDSLRKQAVQWVAELDDLGTPLYASKKGKPLLQVEKNIKHFPEIIYVRYYGPQGKQVMAEFGRSGSAKSLPGTDDHVAQIAQALIATQQSHLFIDERGLLGDYVRVVAPVRVRSIPGDALFNLDLGSQKENVKVIGFIEFGMDYNYYSEPFLKTIAIGGAVIAMLFMVTLIGGRRLIIRALAPLTSLKTPLTRLAKGETDVQVHSSGDEEIMAISEALTTTITALKERDSTLRQLAERDPLTGLANRALFGREVEEEVKHFSQHGKTSAILFIDLDQFKYVNDALGHAMGDRLLIQVAGLLQERLRDNDVLSRFGGDEFTVLARRVDRKGAEHIAASINQIMQDYCFIDGDQRFNVYCSVGVSMIDSKLYSAEEFVAQADMACYAAKSGGRNCYRVFESTGKLKHTSETDIGWAQRIKDMIKEDSLQLYYQPIVATKRGGADYYEVLLRMPGRDGEMILPNTFLPIAQRFGLLREIDNWVITHALESLAYHQSKGRDVVFSINLSGQAFEDDKLVAMIKRLIKRYKVKPTSIIFEITEQVAVRYMDKANTMIRSLHKLGCRFALDDFGVGFSSFNYLKHLPVDFIKIDGSFVMQMHENTIDQAMVRAIIDIARVLGKQTIVESVEDITILRLLKEYGADYLQGHYIGEPGPEPEHRTLRSVAG